MVDNMEVRHCDEQTGPNRHGCWLTTERAFNKEGTVQNFDKRVFSWNKLIRYQWLI